MLTSRVRTPLAAALLATLAFAAMPAARADLPTLIPRSVLFGNPEKAGPAISADGRALAYLAPANGVLSIWVRTIGENDDRVVATDPSRPIRNVVWQPDSKHVLYEQDKGGNENFHVYQTDVATKSTRDLTPFGDKVRSDIEAVDPRYPTQMLVTSNKRDPNVFDVYRVDLQNGTATLDTQNPGTVGGWAEDNHLVVRGALQNNADGSSAILVRPNAAAPWHTLLKASPDDQIAPVAFSANNRSLYVSSSVGANSSQLLRYDLSNDQHSVVASDPTYDVGAPLVDEKTRKLAAVAFQRDRTEWQVLDPSYRSDFEALAKLHAGDIGFLSSTANGRRLIVDYLVDNGPVSYYSYDRMTKRGTFLFVSRPALLKYQLASMQPISYKAADGLTIHGYLTLPVGIEPKNLPMVLFVHGGPWARDSWGYSGYVQWLANRGYAVLQVNFRGSTGYGKNFLNAGNRQWAGTMHQDLIDAKNWAVAQGYADPAKVAIMGGSYGGYAVLAGVTYSPDAFVAGVDIVGPSNLNTLLQSIPPYWSTIRATFALRMGDTTDFLNSQSPLFKADQIKVPLLIGQGANDPRVNRRESDQIVAAMRKNNEPVEYIVFPDEGHGFARPENTKRFNAAVEAFLGKYLGGRVEPAGADESVTAFEH
ncbi:MAG TPA: S9 family peptidase [Candidatus Cybelea sp.]|jgi:dipeptidyl aminopeptidase/acylaminoacyl peptidase|nr:S9 family peptidase [Candidatus Cybelea sp.]